MNSQLIQLGEVLSANIKNRGQVVSYAGKTLRFKYNANDEELLKIHFTTFEINPEFYPNRECEIDLSKKYKSNTILFLDEDDYIKRAESLNDEANLDNFIIISYNDGYLIKESNEQFTEAKAIFFNILTYQALIDFFATNTEFISLHDNILYQFIIFSGDKGPFYIGYDRLDRRVKNLPNLAIELEKIKDFFSRIDFIQFFKEAVINSIHKEPVQDRFFVMIQSLHVLLELSTRDHRIYLKKFGFDKIKTKFKEERIKYFDSIEKNLDAVSKQVTSFPLTFAASIFAAYQVKETAAILVLILCAYALYTLVAWRILNLISFNNTSISTDMESEAKKIENDYDILFIEFKADFQKIRDKIKRLKDLIDLLRIILMGLLVAFAVFFAYETFFALKTPKAPTEVRIVK